MYEVPRFFSSDWLNEYCDQRSPETAAHDDFRFLYLGPAGSWTPLHEDVLQSFSWSANICGTKRWILFPPGAENQLKRNNLLVADVSMIDLAGVPHLEVVQKPGEIIFVPSRWYHQVWNLDETLSINHNWLNASNAENLLMLLRSSMKNIEAELSDCRTSFTADEWIVQREMILKADLGLNMEEFFGMLLTVARNRLRRNGSTSTVCAPDFVRKKDMDTLRVLVDKLVNDGFLSETHELVSLHHDTS